MRAPLQNRVTPFGEIIATSARGTMMGNRGGKLHDEHRRLGSRRWVSKAWICCVLNFKGRRREVMGLGYTELFFLDEVTALAGGHRPCFECRRVDAKVFQAAFPGNPARAGDIDVILHAERLGEKPSVASADLPDGAVWTSGDAAYTRRDRRLFRWSPESWHPEPERQDKAVRLLTPLAIVAALRNGYRPQWS